MEEPNCAEKVSLGQNLMGGSSQKVPGGEESMSRAAGLPKMPCQKCHQNMPCPCHPPKLSKQQKLREEGRLIKGASCQVQAGSES